MPLPARTTSSPSGARLYRGGCQCGAVHYEVRLDLARPSEAGRSVWEQRVAPDDFKLLIGEDCLSGYQFTAEHVHHFFCARCGVRVYLHHVLDERADSYTLDVRTLHSHRVSHAGWQHVRASHALRLS